MSLIVPWNDVGATPCCCEAPCEKQSVDSSWREIILTSTEYALLRAGGTWKRYYAASADLVYTMSTCSITASGTYNETTDYILSGCSLSDSGTDTRSESSTSSTTCSGATLRERAFSSSAILNFVLFNNGSPDQYGAQINISSAQNNFTVQYRTGSLNRTCILLQNYSTPASPTPNNATINFIVNGRSIPVNYNLGAVQIVRSPAGTVTGSLLTQTSHYFEFVPNPP
jgi:hypothetical protein